MSLYSEKAIIIIIILLFSFVYILLSLNEKCLRSYIQENDQPRRLKLCKGNLSNINGQENQFIYSVHTVISFVQVNDYAYSE